MSQRSRGSAIENVTEVVADTGPLRYLVLIEVIDILPRLFGRLLIPEIVGVELSQPSTPMSVREWLAAGPGWLEMRATPPVSGILPARLGAGERAAIGLAEEIGDALLLIDDRAGIEAARARGVRATGTLGVLVRADALGLVDLSTAFERLKATNFRYRPELLDALLAQHEVKKP
jgi:predicted nucleic acid-binding protein